MRFLCAGTLQLVLVILILPPAILAAEGRPSLLGTKSPTDHFTAKVYQRDRSEIVFLREPMPEPVVEEKAPEQQQEAQKNEQLPQVPQSEEEILARFGNPEEQAPIKAIDNAHPAFKGMMAAINIGNDKLAYRYAKQWQDYTARVKVGTDKAIALQGKAMESLGHTDGHGWTSNERYDEYDELVEEDQAQEKEKLLEKDGTLLSFLDEKLRRLVVDPNAYDEAAQDLWFREDHERAKIRQALYHRVPHDAEGKVDLYFFFSPTDQQSIELARELEPLFRASKKDQKFNFAALSLEKASGIVLSRFRQVSQVTYPSMIAGELSSVFKVQAAPAVVLISPTTGESIQEVGMRKGMYIDELRKMIQGDVGK